MQQTIETP